MSDYTWDKLKKDIEILQSYSIPAGYVLSYSAYYYIQNHSVTTADFITKNEPLQKNSILGVPLFPRNDVPRNEVLVFGNREILIEYLELAGKIGHIAAIKRMATYVDSGLIQESTIRALLEPN